MTKKGMENKIVLFGSPSPSEIQFIEQDTVVSPNSIPHSPPMEVEVQSAPDQIDLLFTTLETEYKKFLCESGRQVPPQWTISDLTKMVCPNDTGELEFSCMKQTYYDLMICGTRAWSVEELFDFIDLINYCL